MNESQAQISWLSCATAPRRATKNPGLATGASEQPVGSADSAAATLSPAPWSLAGVLAVPLHVFDQLLQSRVEDRLARAPRPLVPDHPLVIEDIEGRRAAQIPLMSNGLRFGKGSPVHFLLVHHLFEFFRAVRVNIDADQGER